MIWKPNFLNMIQDALRRAHRRPPFLWGHVEQKKKKTKKKKEKEEEYKYNKTKLSMLRRSVLEPTAQELSKWRWENVQNQQKC